MLTDEAEYTDGARGQRPRPRFNRNAAWQSAGRPAEISLRKHWCIIPARGARAGPLCLLCSKTCLVFDWLYSNYYCLWSTITTPAMLWLEMNESGDSLPSPGTTLKWEVSEKIQLCKLETLYETDLSPHWAPVLRFHLFHFAVAAGRPCCRCLRGLRTVGKPMQA